MTSSISMTSSAFDALPVRCTRAVFVRGSTTTTTFVPARSHAKRFLFDLSVGIAGRYDFECGIGWTVEESGGVGDALGADECGIGSADGVGLTRDAESGFR